MKFEQMSMAELKSAIERLKGEMEKRRLEEVAAVVAEIRDKMDRHGLSVADLGFTAAERSAGRAKVARRSDPAVDRRAVVAPKYQDPATGATWSGRGRMPRWLSDAVESGRSREEFLIPA